jgi:hypothetical protein
VEEGKRERERAPGVAVGSADRGVGMVRGGSARSQRRWAGEQGRAVGRGRRGAVVSGGVWEEGSKVRQRGGGALTGGPEPHSVGAQFKLGFKSIQEYSSGSNKF